MDFYSSENIDGVRFSWNNLPANKVYHLINIGGLS
jgi:hypothetical protein